MSLIEEALKRQEKMRTATDDTKIIATSKPDTPDCCNVKIKVPRDNRAVLEFNAKVAELNAAANRPSRTTNILLMPAIAIIVFFTLLFAKRELVRSFGEHTTNDAVGDVDEIVVNDTMSNAGQQSFHLEPAPATTVTNLAAASTETNLIAVVTNSVTTNPQVITEVATNATPAAVIQEITSASSATKPPPWPDFSLKGIATGFENLVILSSGEMLAAGEKAKNGVRIFKVTKDSATFMWYEEKKTLRRGESSEKLPDEECGNSTIKRYSNESSSDHR